MRRFRPAIILLFLVVLGGCKTTGDKGSGGDGRSSTGGGGDRADTGATKSDPIGPNHWLHTTPGGGTVGNPGGRPSIGGFPSPIDSKTDPKGETKSLLAGYVVGPDGQKVRKAIIQVEPVNNPGEGAIDYETSTDGSFMISGLTTGKSYRLTVKLNDEGVLSSGQVLTKVPNVYVRINLIEGLELTVPKGERRPVTEKKTVPEVKPPKPDNDFNTKPKNDPPKPDPLKEPGLTLPDFGPLPAPGGPTGRLPTPKPLDRNDLPNDGWQPTGTDSLPPPGPSRPDLNTRRPDDGFRPPPVDLPPPRQSRRAAAADEFTLVDSSGRERKFPTAKPGELLLLDFMTTTCVPCQKALPTLTAVQARYAARGLSVIGVACDDEPLRTRVIVAEKYRTDHAVNFSIYTEPGKSPGEVMKRFGVRVYPTAVLLDSTGAVLWQGNPGAGSELGKAIEKHLPAK